MLDIRLALEAVEEKLLLSTNHNQIAALLCLLPIRTVLTSLVVKSLSCVHSSLQHLHLMARYKLY
jgi:hypothetical protein